MIPSFDGPAKWVTLTSRLPCLETQLCSRRSPSDYAARVNRKQLCVVALYSRFEIAC